MLSSTPRLVRHDRFSSRALSGERGVTVWLPPGYEDAGDARYPVLYLQDGQNLFDPEAAYVKGETWRVAETAGALIDAGQLQPLLIVGIDHGEANRLHEYTPTPDRRRGGGGASGYARLIIDELKPFIDRTYRTRPEPAHTGIGGSSLGALVALYLGLTRPDVFGRAAVLSPSVWWDRRAILRTVRQARPAPPLRVWVDIGSREGRLHVENARLLRAGLIDSGWIEGETLHYEEVADGTHSERAWADRFGRVVQWLFR